jgi:hypothetical protein
MLPDGELAIKVPPLDVPRAENSNSHPALQSLADLSIHRAPPIAHTDKSHRGLARLYPPWTRVCGKDSIRGRRGRSFCIWRSKSSIASDR